MPAPLFDDDGGFPQAVEDLAVEAFVTQLSVKGFAVAIFPGATGFDVQGPGSQPGEPAAHDLGRHLGTVVRSNVLRDTTLHHHIGHRLDDPEAVDAARNPDREALPGELVDQCHQPEFATVVGLCLDEVVAPHMIAVLRPQPNARAVIEP